MHGANCLLQTFPAHDNRDRKLAGTLGDGYNVDIIARNGGEDPTR